MWLCVSSLALVMSKIDTKPLHAACLAEKVTPYARHNQTQKLNEPSHSFVVDEVVPEHSLRSAIQLPPPGDQDFSWHVQDLVLFQSVPKSEDGGVVEIMLRRATVHQHIYGVVAAACPRPRGGTNSRWDQL